MGWLDWVAQEDGRRKGRIGGGVGWPGRTRQNEEEGAGQGRMEEDGAGWGRIERPGRTGQLAGGRLAGCVWTHHSLCACSQHIPAMKNKNVRKLVRFSRTNLLCWDSRVDKEDGSNICIHLLRVKCQPVIPREVHGPMVHMCAPCTCSRRARRQHPGNTLRVCSTGPLCQGPTNKNL